MIEVEVDGRRDRRAFAGDGSGLSSGGQRITVRTTIDRSGEAERAVAEDVGEDLRLDVVAEQGLGWSRMGAGQHEHARLRLETPHRLSS